MFCFCFVFVFWLFLGFFCFLFVCLFCFVVGFVFLFCFVFCFLFFWGGEEGGGGVLVSHGFNDLLVDFPTSVTRAYCALRLLLLGTVSNLWLYSSPVLFNLPADRLYVRIVLFVSTLSLGLCCYSSTVRGDFFRVELLKWLPCQAPSIIGSAPGLVGLVTVYCDWVRYKV